MKRAGYENNETVPLGFVDTPNALYFSTTPTAAFTADTAVRIEPTAGPVWIQVGAAVTAATADEAGNMLISGAQDICIPAGDKIVATGTVCVTPFK